MLEHIPSNPEHTVIRGDWASYHCDRTNTCHWSAVLCKGVWVQEGLRSRGEEEEEEEEEMEVRGEELKAAEKYRKTAKREGRGGNDAVSDAAVSRARRR